MSDNPSVRAFVAETLHEELFAAIERFGPEFAVEIALGGLDAVASALVGLRGPAAAAAVIGRLSLEIHRLPLDGGRAN